MRWLRPGDVRGAAVVQGKQEVLAGARQPAGRAARQPREAGGGRQGAGEGARQVCHAGGLLPLQPAAVLLPVVRVMQGASAGLRQVPRCISKAQQLQVAVQLVSAGQEAALLRCRTVLLRCREAVLAGAVCSRAVLRDVGQRGAAGAAHAAALQAPQAALQPAIAPVVAQLGFVRQVVA